MRPVHSNVKKIQKISLKGETGLFMDRFISRYTVVDQVEYQIFDEYNDKMDISVYDTIEIPIEYKIKDTSLLKLDDVLNFKNMGVDVFNLKDDFFNDICYAYSDNDTSSDMLLFDRVSDIYRNVSLCGEGCEYQLFN